MKERGCHFPPPLCLLPQALPFDRLSPAPAVLQFFHWGNCYLLQQNLYYCFRIAPLLSSPPPLDTQMASFSDLLMLLELPCTSSFLTFSAPFIASPSSAFLRLYFFFAPFLPFQLIPWQLCSSLQLCFHHLCEGGYQIWVSVPEASFFFASGILRFHLSSLSSVQLPTFSG